MDSTELGRSNPLFGTEEEGVGHEDGGGGGLADAGVGLTSAGWSGDDEWRVTKRLSLFMVRDDLTLASVQKSGLLQLM